MSGDGTCGWAERRRDRERRPAQLRWIAQARCLAAALDLLPTALLLLRPGPPSRVWHANLAARRLLAGGALHLAGDGVLDARGSDPAIDALVDCCLRDDGPAPRELSLPSDALGRELTFRVQPLDFGACGDLPVRRLVMAEVLVRGPAGAVLEALCLEFRLTRKEAEAALRLHATGSVADIAMQAQRSVHTVRTQLKAAMCKTSTRNQAGLVALVGDRLYAGYVPSGPFTPAGR